MLLVVVINVFFVFGTDGAPLEYSDTRFDNLELTSVLNNDELYIKLFQCLIGHGKKCTPDWEILKDALPSALLDNCDTCGGKQKYGTKILLEFLVHNKPNDMRMLEGEYDPDGSYRKELEKMEKESNDIDRKRSAMVENSEVEIVHKTRRVIK